MTDDVRKEINKWINSLMERHLDLLPDLTKSMDYLSTQIAKGNLMGFELPLTPELKSEVVGLLDAIKKAAEASDYLLKAVPMIFTLVEVMDLKLTYLATNSEQSGN